MRAVAAGTGMELLAFDATASVELHNSILPLSRALTALRGRIQQMFAYHVDGIS